LKKQIKIWQLIADSLQQKIPVVLLYVLESKGSSPGRQGFFMTVTANGEMEGSIGGGIMEHKFVEMAKDRLQNKKRNTENREQDTRNMQQEDGNSSGKIKKQVHDKSAAKDQSGMICSGEQTIFIYEVKEKELDEIERLIASLEQNRNGKLQLSPSGIKFYDEPPQTNFHFQFESEESWLFEEKTGYKNQLCIIGGGHCALALSNLMAQMDFYIRVYDERKNLKTMQENSSAHEKHLLENYEQLQELIAEGENNYVVIMTFGYRTDDIALQALAEKKFAYLGLLGSLSKIEKMFAGYRAEGINENWLNSIYAPIGLQIKSETPEEIAVSIAAQIISIKNTKR